MKLLSGIFLALVQFSVFTSFATAQNKIILLVKDSVTNELLVGVNVIMENPYTIAITDSAGIAKLNNIGAGDKSISISYVGYQKLNLHFSVPLKNGISPTVVLLVPESEELDEVTVTATRTRSRIEDLPTKIEVLGLGDMQEENSIRPANITSLLGDIAGIQMQQTSASSGNTNARIQGLNGRYSQVLKDGMPIYGGFSGSFSILQVPPIDLKQIEIIKGSSSTLYGGDAIGGIINLVSKTPSQKPETNILINQTSLNETDANTYISRKYKKAGFTFFAGQVHQSAVDVNNDGFSDVPKIQNFVIHPKVFYYLSNNSSLSAGISTTIEDRKGGDMQVVQHSANSEHQYFVSHKSFRNTAEINYEQNMENGSQLSFKGTTSLLDRTITTNHYSLDAEQTLYYSELSYFLKKDKYDFVFGLNFTGDNFRPKNTDSVSVSKYHYSTLGGFVQNTLHITNKLLVESGLRYDYHSSYGSFVLPRLSFMYKFTPTFSVRLNGGLGYKIPVLFSYIDEETDLNNVSASQPKLVAEKSKGLNFDINYSTQNTSGITFTINQSFFYTALDNPVITAATNINETALINASKPVETEGSQTYLRLAYDDLELYVSYVYTHAVKKYDNARPWFLATPEHNLSSTLTYAPTKYWRFGLENMLIGKQYIENDTKTPAYDFMAAMIERKIKRFTIVLNCENLFDYRQKDIVNLPIVNPTFNTIWAPIDGRVVNLSVNIKW